MKVSRALTRHDVLRDRSPGQHVPVTSMELFFDLVYVFTIIELSTHLIEDLSWAGALQTLVLFLPVWWGWNYTSWATGWIDPESPPVVVLLGVLMVLGIVMAAVIPDAFIHHGQTFAEVYVAMQVIRSSFMVWAFGLRDTMGRNYLHLLVWSIASGMIWIAGALVHDPTVRLIIWAGAAVVDLGAPIHGFKIPGVGTAPMETWTLAGGHLAERCQLVLMIAFGETVLRLGEAYMNTNANHWSEVALVLGFILSFSLWAIYFLHHAPLGAARIEQADEQEAAQLGRSAYAYAHMVMVAAVIILAVAVHLAIDDPTAPVESGFAWVCLSGPALYLIGISLSKRWLGRGRILPGVLGVAALAVFGTAACFGDRILLEAVTVAICVALAIWSQLEHAGEEIVTA